MAKQRQASPIPAHIAIIMDGNGRWAQQRGLPRMAGHKAGVETVRRIVRACVDLGVEVLTLYTFSTENWRRPEPEVAFLMRLAEDYARSPNSASPCPRTMNWWATTPTAWPGRRTRFGCLAKSVR